jgi:hypothetical protein
MMGYKKHKTKYQKNTSNIAHCVLLFFCLWHSHGCLGAMLTTATIIAASIVPHVASPEKDQNSKFEVPFLLSVYAFVPLIKLENCMLNLQNWEEHSVAHLLD